MSGPDQTTIAVTQSTKERLRKRGEKGDSYEQIVVSLLEETADNEGEH